MRSMGVFMTASEANYQRVLTLLRIEKLDRIENAEAAARFLSKAKKSLAFRRGKPGSVIVEPSQIESFQSTLSLRP